LPPSPRFLASFEKYTMAKGRLKAVLDKHQGVDRKLERQKKLQKAAAKLKKKKESGKPEGLLLGSNKGQVEGETEDQPTGDETVDSLSEEGGVRVYTLGTETNLCIDF
jgi:hypothetical protein